MYGLPKLIELVRRKSPLCTKRLFESPSTVIFSFVELIYIPSFSVSPILIQFIPSKESVRYSLIGRGELPRAIIETNGKDEENK